MAIVTDAYAIIVVTESGIAVCKAGSVDMSAHITPEMMATYQSSARQRAAKLQTESHERGRRAWDVAKKASVLLKHEFGAEQVMLFGSLARGEPLSSHSDVDLAVWNLDENLLYRAVSRLLEIDPSISVDLLRIEDTSSNLQNAILAEGVLL